MEDLSRRRVLAGTAALGTAVVPGASAQQGSRITTEAIAPQLDAFDTTDYAGFFVQLTDLSDESLDDTAAQCAVQDWQPDEPDAFVAQFINRFEDSHASARGVLFANGETDLETGTLFVVNRQHDCPGDWTGVELEEIRARGLPRRFGVTPGGGDGETSGALPRAGDR